MSKNEALIESKSLRESYIDRTDVLDKVKKLRLLPDDVNGSIELVADYYEVGREAISSLIKDNREELEADGLKVLIGNELKSFKDLAIISNMARSFTIIPRRAILRIGMLLRDSIVAREVRDELLDVEAGISKEMRAIFLLDRRTVEFDLRLEKLENNTTIDYGQQQTLKKAGNKTVVGIMGGKDSPAYLNRNLRKRVYSALWGDFQDYFNVNSRNNTLLKDFAKALDYVAAWKPQGKLLREIEEANGQLSMIGS